VRSERPQSVLHAMAKLRQHILVDVLWTLRDEENAHTLRANKTNDLLNLIEQRLARPVENQMRFVEEENELRLVQVADFGQLVIQRREHPQHERAEKIRLVLNVLELEDADQSLPIPLLHEIVDIEL